MKILAFATSNSSDSINRRLALHAARRVNGASVETLDINDYELPIFSEQREMQLGQPDLAKQFLARLGAADALIIGYAEHNGGYTAAWKNLLDWSSRIERRFFQHKPALFVAASPGPGGAANVLRTAVESAPHFGASLVGSVSMPRFNEGFDAENNRVLDSAVDNQLVLATAQLVQAVTARQVAEQA